MGLNKKYMEYILDIYNHAIVTKYIVYVLKMYIEELYFS